MKRIVILTGHFPNQKRRGSILWVSQHLQEMGWHVTHVTVGYSWLSLLKTDRRLKALDHKPRRGTHNVSKSLTTVFGYSPLHPVNLGHDVLNVIGAGLSGLFTGFWAAKLREPLANADLVLCESGAPVLLAPILSKFAPDVPRIYRVNDDISLLNAPQYLLDDEQNLSSHFTRISTASPYLKARFSHPNITLDAMGIPRALVQIKTTSPYGEKHNFKNAICAGTTQLDLDALVRIAQLKPLWRLHVVGSTRLKKPDLSNIVFHGEKSFVDTVRYVAHADIGLAPYLDKEGIQYQTTNSNRMLLYRHFGLPIIGPDRLCHPEIPSLMGYSDPNALDRCEVFEPLPEEIKDWSDLALSLAQNPVIDPPDEVTCMPDKSICDCVKTEPALASIE